MMLFESAVVWHLLINFSIMILCFFVMINKLNYIQEQNQQSKEILNFLILIKKQELDKKNK